MAQIWPSIQSSQAAFFQTQSVPDALCKLSHNFFLMLVKTDRWCNMVKVSRNSPPDAEFKLTPNAQMSRVAGQPAKFPGSARVFGGKRANANIIMRI